MGFNQCLCVGLTRGICRVVLHNLNISIYDIFGPGGYYKNYIISKGCYGGYLFKPLINNKKSLHQRLNFLKTEVKDLKRLQKLGYTDI